MKNSVLILVAILFVGYCCFVAGRIFTLNQPNETETVESITAAALDALHNKDYPLAIAQLNRALARTPNDAALHGNLGLALMHSGNAQAAIPEFQECLLLDPERLDIAKQLGMSLFKFERLQEAKERFEAVVNKRPDDAEAYEWLFTINNRLDLSLENLPVLERLAELRPDDLQYVYAQIMVYHQNDQGENALRMFEKLPAAEQATVKARHVLGSIHAKRRDYPKAIEVLEQLVGDHPEHEDSQKLLELTRTQAAQARQFDQEISEIDKALEASPEDIDLHFKRGMILTKAGRADEATGAFEDCLSRLDPKDIETTKRLGIQFFSLEQLDFAERCLESIADEANDIGVYELLMGIHSRQNRPLENLPILEKMATLKPEESKYILWQLGIYLENKNPQKALELMLQMPEQWQADIKNQYIMGVTYYQLKDFAKAIELLQKVVHTEPENADAIKILELSRTEAAAASKSKSE